MRTVSCNKARNLRTSTTRIFRPLTREFLFLFGFEELDGGLSSAKPASRSSALQLRGRDIKGRAISQLSFKHPAATDHGSFDGNGDEGVWVFSDGVAAEDNEVCKFAWLNRPLIALFERGVSSMQGPNT